MAWRLVKAYLSTYYLNPAVRRQGGQGMGRGGVQESREPINNLASKLHNRFPRQPYPSVMLLLPCHHLFTTTGGNPSSKNINNHLGLFSFPLFLSTGPTPSLTNLSSRRFHFRLLHSQFIINNLNKNVCMCECECYTSALSHFSLNAPHIDLILG